MQNPESQKKNQNKQTKLIFQKKIRLMVELENSFRGWESLKIYEQALKSSNIFVQDELNR